MKKRKLTYREISNFTGLSVAGVKNMRKTRLHLFRFVYLGVYIYKYKPLIYKLVLSKFID